MLSLKKQPLCDTQCRVFQAHGFTGLVLTLALATPVQAQSLEWDSNGVAPLGGAGTWDLASLRWYNGTSYQAWNNAALNDAVFGTAAGTITLSAPITVHNLTFSITGYSITGSTLTLGGVNPNVAVNATTATLSSIINGVAGLTKSGTGTLILGGSNIYSGATTVSAGTLQVGSGGTTGTLGGGDVVNNGTLAFSRSNAYEVANLISGTGNVTKAGTGTTTFTANNSYAGTTGITAGTLQIGNGGTSGSLGAGNVTLSSGAILAINRSDAATIANVIAGTGGQLRQIGTGTTTLTGTNTYTGVTTISSGTLQVGDGGTTGTLGTGAITNNATLAINRSNALTVASVISGTGTLRQQGAGTTTLSGTSTFTGRVEFNGGVLAISNLQNGGVNSNLGASSNAAANLSFDGGTLRYTGAARTTDRNFLIEDGGATLDGSGTAALTWNGTASYDVANEARSLTLTGTRAGNIFGSGLTDNGAGELSLTKAGTGSWLLTGNNMYSGTTTISAGTLQIGNGGTTGTLGTGAVINNGNLTLSRSDALTVANTISGTGSVTKSGTGTTTLIGNNTYAGATTITAGTLQIGSGGTIGTLGTGNVANTGTLAINRSDAYTIGQVISGAGALRQEGAGTTTLTGTNTFSGATTINAGTLQIGNGGATGAIGAGAIANNATLSLNRSNALTMANVISGTGVLRQSGTGTTTLSGTSTFTGAVELDAGVLAIGNLQNGGVNSNIGASSNAAANLRFDGGTLRYAGAVRTTDRNFLIEDGGAILDGSGTGVLTWGGTAAYDVANEARNLTLTGTTSGNVFSGALSDNGTGALSLIKSGTGRWILTGANTLSGTTTISAGTLQVGNGGTTGTLGAGAVVDNGTLTFSRSDALLVSNAISGTGTLTQAGVGTTSLTGSNTYAGATTISAGTLQIGNGGTTGSLGTGNVANTGTLAINRSDAYTIGQVVSGTGQLRQLGAGTTALTGANTYTGATTISAGTLQIGNGGTTGSLSTGAITNDATLAVNRNNALTLSNVINGTGLLRHDGIGTTTLSGTSTFTGAVEFNGGVVQVSNLANGGTSSNLGASTNAATNLSFDGGALRLIGTTARSTNRNFVIEDGGATIEGNGTGTGLLTWTGTASYDVANEARSLTLGGTASGNIFAGMLVDNGTGALSLTKSGASRWLLTGNNTNSGTTTIAAGTLQVGNSGTTGTLGSGAVLNSGNLTLARSDALTVAGAISGTGSVTKSANGTTTLTGNNDYTGITTITAGTLQIGSGGTIGTLGTGNITATGTLAINRSDAYTLGQTISGAGALRQIGTGTTTLAGTNTYTGTTTITAGTLQVGNGGASGTLGTGNVVNAGVLAIDRSNAYTIGQIVSGAGQLRQVGTGTTILTGANTYTGATTISGGTLQIGNAGTAGALAATTAITNNATLSINRSNALTMANVIGGTGTLRQQGTGTTTLSGTSTFTGGVEVNGGVLAVGNLQNGGVNSNLGASSNAAANLSFDGGTLRYTGAARTTDRNFLIEDGGATLDGSGTAALTWNGTASYDIADEARNLTLTGTRAGNIFGGALTDNGAGELSLTKSGTGSWILTGDNTYSGATTINVGTLQVGNNGTSGTLGTGDVVNNGALVFSRTNALDVGGDISGAGSVTKSATGTTILTGDNTYTGTTTISAGTLQIGDGGTTGTLGAGNVTNNATLTFQRSDALNVANTISGTGTINQSGSGTTQLSNAVAANATNIALGTLQVDGSLTTAALSLGATLDVRGTVAALGATPTLLTGTSAANTLLVGGAGTLRASGDFGAGSDLLDLAGLLDTGAGTLNLGADDDTLIWRDGASHTGTLSGGAGINTLVVDTSTTANLPSVQLFQELETSGSGTLSITGAITSLGSVNVNAGSLEVVGSMTEVGAATVASGATLNVTGSFTGTSASDTWSVAGTLSGTGAINLGAGDDVLTLNDGATLNAPIAGGADALADTLVLNNTAAFSLAGSATNGFEQLVKSNAGVASLIGAHVYSAGTSINAGTLEVTGSLDTPSIALTDAATLDVRGTVTPTIVSGTSGINTVLVRSAATLAATGDLGDGEDALDVAGTLDTGAGSFSLGVGDDTLTIHDDTRILGAVAGGAGNNTFNTDIAEVADLGAATDFQSLIKTGIGTLNINGSATSQFTTVSASTGTINVAATGRIDGVTDTSIASGATLRVVGAYSGSAGADQFRISGTLSGVGAIDLDAGDDLLTLNDGAVVTAAIAGGTQSIADTVALNTNTAFALAGTATTGFEQLVKGGSGVATLTGIHDYSVATRINAGTLAVAGMLDTTALALADDTTLQIFGTATADVITGSSGVNSLSVAATGTLNAAGDLGNGADVLDIVGTLDTGLGVFGLGDGDDLLTIHDGAIIVGTVAGGAGSNTLNTNIATVADFGAVTGFQSLIKSGAGTLNVTGPVTSVFNSVAIVAGTLRVASTATIDPATTLIAAGATLQVDGTYLGTAGNDTMTLFGTVAGAGVIDLGAGDDALTLNDGFVISGRIGGGNGLGDAIVINNAAAMSFEGGGTYDFEVLTKQNTGALTLSGDHSYAAVNVGTGALMVGNGLDTSTLTLGDNSLMRVTGTLQGAGAAAATITGSTGVNRIEVDAGATLRAGGTLGAGADVLDVAGTLFSSGFDLGDGDDALTIRDGTRIVGTISGGAGANSLSTNLTGVADVDALTGFQSLLKNGTGVLNLTGPEASTFDRVVISAGTVDVSSMSSASGVRATGVAQGATLHVDGSYLGSGAADSLGLAGTLSGAGIISLGAGNDLFTMRDSAILNATVNGGDAQAVGDTLVIDSVGNFLLDTSRIVGFENLTKQSSGSMSLSGAGVFSNSISIDAGTLVSEVSLTASQVNIALGSTLVASGSVTGNVSNAGTLALGTASFDRLVVRGSYLGVDGLLDLRVALADDGSQSDRLAIEGGAATGTTRVRVINQGGLGARTTGSGIHVIETSNGATTTSDAFRLDAPVLAGAFRYELFHGGTDDADQQGWYLRSLAPVRDIASLTTALVPVAHNYGLGLVSTLQDREGAKLQSDCDGRMAGGCQWGRVWYRSGEQGARSGGPAFDYDVTNLQVGTDIHIDSQRNSEDRGGIYLNVGFLGADPLRDDGSNAGEIQGRAYSLATYLTHRDALHWYLDSSLVATYLDDLRLEPSDDTRMITSAWTVAASFEGGRRFSLGSRFSVEPQLQLIAQHIKQSDADTVGAHIAFEDSDTVVGRAGVSLAADIDPNRWSVWLRANYWSDLAGDAQTTISADDGAAATVFSTDFEDSWLEIAAGIAARFSPHARMHVSISNTEGLGDSDSQALQGNLGVQVQW